MSILSGNATTNGGVIITIPAMSNWYGHITLSASVAVPAGGSALNANARVTLAGAGSSPPAGDYLRLDLSAPASSLAGIGTSDSGSLGTPMAVSAGSSPATLTLNTSNTTMQSASAVGRLDGP